MSSLLFRAALGQAARLRAPTCATNFVKLNFSVYLPRTGSCRCEALVTLSSPVHRNYSTEKKNEELKSNVEEEDSYKVIIDGKEVVYAGFLAKNIRRIKLLSLVTSVFGIGIQPLVYIKAMSSGQVTNFTLPLFGVIGVFAIATPLLLNIVTKRYILQIDYDHKTDKYIAHVYNLILMRKKIEFTPEDVTVPTVLGMFANCAIKGKPVFMDAKFFSDQAHYVRIMGYDKPVDLLVDKPLELQTTENLEKKEKNN